MTRGELIRKYRKEKNLTQEQLAERCKMATITIRQYENGKRTPQIEQLAVIAEKLDISVLELLEESEKQNSFFQTQLINLSYKYPDVIAFLKHGEVHAFIAASDGYVDLSYSVLDRFRNLNVAGQKKVTDYIDDLVSSKKYQRENATLSSAGKEKPPEEPNTPSDGDNESSNESSNES